MLSSRPSLKNVEHIPTVYPVGLLSFADSLCEAKIFQDFGEDLVQQFALLVQRLGERFLQDLFEFGSIESSLGHILDLEWEVGFQ